MNGFQELEDAPQAGPTRRALTQLRASRRRGCRPRAVRGGQRRRFRVGTTAAPPRFAASRLPIPREATLRRNQRPWKRRSTGALLHPPSEVRCAHASPRLLRHGTPEREPSSIECFCYEHVFSEIAQIHRPQRRLGRSSAQPLFGRLSDLHLVEYVYIGGCEHVIPSRESRVASRALARGGVASS